VAGHAVRPGDRGLGGLGPELGQAGRSQTQVPRRLLAGLRPAVRGVGAGGSEVHDHRVRRLGNHRVPGRLRLGHGLTQRCGRNTTPLAPILSYKITPGQAVNCKFLFASISQRSYTKPGGSCRIVSVVGAAQNPQKTRVDGLG